MRKLCFLLTVALLTVISVSAQDKTKLVKSITLFGPDHDYVLSAPNGWGMVDIGRPPEKSVAVMMPMLSDMQHPVNISASVWVKRDGKTIDDIFPKVDTGETKTPKLQFDDGKQIGFGNNKTATLRYVSNEPFHIFMACLDDEKVWVLISLHVPDQMTLDSSLPIFYKLVESVRIQPHKVIR